MEMTNRFAPRQFNASRLEYSLFTPRQFSISTSWMYEPSRKAQAPQKVLQLIPQRWYFCSGYAKNPKKPLHVQRTLSLRNESHKQHWMQHFNATLTCPFY